VARLRLSVLILTLVTGVALSGPCPAIAQAVTPAPYDNLKQVLDATITFEGVPRRAEPGINFEAPMRMGRAWLSERFTGQEVEAVEGVDFVTGLPQGPLTPKAGQARQNLSVAYHQGFDSNALFPLGTAGFPRLAARGEGAVAILFDQGQRAVALRVHSDYPSPLGSAPQPGQITLQLYTRQGALIATYQQALALGITEIGLRRSKDLPDIAGILVLNDDPGGIAIDDILYQTAPAAF
jgi:hypothetical protein